MKTPTVIVSSLLGFIGATGLYAGDPIADDQLGLSKSSVFAEPTPEAFTYSEGAPGSSQNPDLALSFPGAPPQIPHNIAGYTPVTAKNNQCLGCHNNPALRGKPKQRGIPTPMPESHYTDPAFGKPEAGLPGKIEKSVAGSRYVCTQCHAPQADVKPLVPNTF